MAASRQRFSLAGGRKPSSDARIELNSRSIKSPSTTRPTTWALGLTAYSINFPLVSRSRVRSLAGRYPARKWFREDRDKFSTPAESAYSGKKISVDRTISTYQM